MAANNSEDSKGRAWALLLTTHAQLIERVEAAFVASELPPLAWYDVLWELEKAPDGRLRMRELAQRVVITRSNLTRLIDRLETAGVIAREACPDDRRGAYAVLNAAGRAMRKKMWPVYSQQIDVLFASHLTAPEAKQLATSLRKLLAPLQEASR